MGRMHTAFSEDCQGRWLVFQWDHNKETSCCIYCRALLLSMTWNCSPCPQEWFGCWFIVSVLKLTLPAFPAQPCLPRLLHCTTRTVSPLQEGYHVSPIRDSMVTLGTSGQTMRILSSQHPWPPSAVQGDIVNISGNLNIDIIMKLLLSLLQLAGKYMLVWIHSQNFHVCSSILKWATSLKMQVPFVCP